jgi:hypothetical protein
MSFGSHKSSTVGAPYLSTHSQPIYFEIEIKQCNSSGRILAGFTGTNFQHVTGQASSFADGIGFDSISWCADSMTGSGGHRSVDHLIWLISTLRFQV